MNVRSHMTNFSHWCHSRITNKIKSKLFRRVPLGLALPGRHSLVPRPRPTQACRQQRLETTAPRSPRCVETIYNIIYKGLPSRSSRHFWKPQQPCYTAMYTYLSFHHVVNKLAGGKLCQVAIPPPFADAPLPFAWARGKGPSNGSSSIFFPFRADIYIYI